jgi:hypothetical protein
MLRTFTVAILVVAVCAVYAGAQSKASVVRGFGQYVLGMPMSQVLLADPGLRPGSWPVYSETVKTIDYGKAKETAQGVGRAPRPDGGVPASGCGVGETVTRLSHAVCVVVTLKVYHHRYEGRPCGACRGDEPSVWGVP